ncbi:MAG: ATP-binding protein [Candidatus Hadarchaeota archaeon]
MQSISDEFKTKIFAEGSSGNEGTGLGLYIAKKTVDRYGGAITVEDNQPRGSVFTLKLRPN